jgi:capsular polysaccharide transport system permease protein
MMRETKTRFGTNKFGYLFALLEPMSQILLFTIIFGIILERTLPSGVEYPIFLMVSISFWTLFNSIINMSTNAINANKSLLVYKNVKPLDTIISRVFIEITLFIIVFIILTFTFYLFDFHTIPFDILLFILTLFEFIIFSFSLGFLFSIIFIFSPLSGKIIKIAMKPLYFISAVLYPINLIPIEYQEYFLINPIANLMDLLRYSYFEGYNIQYGSHLYINILSLFILSISFFYYNLLNKKMINLES